MTRHPHKSTDELLLEAVRKRALRDLEERQAGITNNVYGGGHGGGVMDHLGGGSTGAIDPADYDYMVDITRENLKPGDLDPSDPEGGRQFKNEGWYKRVHRHRDEKKKGR